MSTEIVNPYHHIYICHLHRELTQIYGEKTRIIDLTACSAVLTWFTGVMKLMTTQLLTV